MLPQHESSDSYARIVEFKNKVLHAKLKGFLKPEQAEEFHSLMNDFIKKNKVDFLLIDQSELKVLSKEVREGIMEAVNKMSKQGIKKVASVIPEDIFAKAGLENIQKLKPDHGEIPLGNFGTVEACMDWLLK